MSRYNPALVMLHWVSACMIIIQLTLGDIISPSAHIIAGVLIGVLTALRLSIKLQSTNPLYPEVGSDFLNRLAQMAHHTIYGLVFAVLLSGIGLAVEIDLPFSQDSGEPDAENNSKLLIHSVHQLLTDALIFIVCLHVLAALFHQFIRKDRLFSRMWFGR
ncbi:MAG: hypothetical protein GQ470_02775 [Gammaproteobacteria bacterium]|nr:hypothetical protein [Gammaproteobacteria bacterium]